MEIEFGVTKLAKVRRAGGLRLLELLKSAVRGGFYRHYPEDDGSLKERLDYELDVIRTMGYVDYFLIVWDFIHFAKSHGIMVGPGRGSAAGSIVAYCLAITDIDPVKYQLIFERFLNPERVSMPDIDVDFCFERRQEVIDYVVEKYGKDRVVQIVTFGTLAAKGVVRDVGRVLDLPYAKCDAIAKMIPGDLGMTLEKALKASPDLRNAYNEDEEVKYLIDMSMRLEGLPRHSSMHAAGVVISRESVDEYVPLSKAADGTITTQFTMTTLEELGLLKMDFLGLRTLTVIQNAVDQVKKNRGVAIDLKAIDYNDKAVLESIGTGKNDGVFQLESGGMKSFMKELKPGESGGHHRRHFPVPPGPHGLYSQISEGQERQELHHLRLPPAGGDLKAHLRLYRLPGAGHANRPRSGGLHLGPQRPGAPRHVQEKGRGHGAGAAELRLR